MNAIRKQAAGVERLTETQLEAARKYQREAWTFSEIATFVDASREAVVQSLYWDTRP